MYRGLYQTHIFWPKKDKGTLRAIGLTRSSFSLFHFHKAARDILSIFHETYRERDVVREGKNKDKSSATTN